MCFIGANKQIYNNKTQSNSKILGVSNKNLVKDT